MLVDALMIVGSGLLGSAHCVGMCGPIVVTIGANTQTPRANLLRQLVYSIGRIVTYSFLGAVGGFAGFWITEKLGTRLVHFQAGFAILAGLLLVVQGMLTAGWIRLPGAVGSQVSCLAGSFFRQMFQSPGLEGAFAAGIATGFLPCGLVYAFLALAVSTGSLFAGAAIMFCFGLGTIPLMVLTGCGGSLLKVAFRQRLLTLAAICVLVMGATSVARGAAFFLLPSESSRVACPFCPTN